jgi:hypothetical protein
MIRTLASLILLGLVLAAAPDWVVALPVTIEFDENGNAIGTVGQGRLPPGGNLVYQLPFDATTGFLLVKDSPVLTAPVEDIVAFSENGVVGFFSENADGVDSLADQSSGFAVPVRANIVDILEVGPEGANGFFYTPVAGQPGFTPDFSVTYHILSDGTLAVPEPATLALLVPGLLLLLLHQRRASECRSRGRCSGGARGRRQITSR